MAAILSAIVETKVINGTESPKAALRRTLRKVQTLAGRSLKGHQIDALITDPMWGDNPCIVPDFGHNHTCKCEHPEEFGVFRFFGLTLAVEGHPHDVFGTYEIEDGFQLIVCSVSQPPRQGKPLRGL
jgi:hypothetical protein